MLSKSLAQFSVDGWGCVPSLVGVMVVMATSFRRTYASLPQFPGLLYSIPLTLWLATVDPSLRQRLLDTHRQVWLSLLWGHAAFSWFLVGTRFSCALQESVSPVLWKLCNQIPLVFKVKFPGGSQSLCQILRLGNLLWALELLQQCESFFCRMNCSTVCNICSVALWCDKWQHPPRGLMPHTLAPRSAAARAPVPVVGHCWLVPLQETLRHSKAGLA